MKPRIIKYETRGEENVTKSENKNGYTCFHCKKCGGECKKFCPACGDYQYEVICETCKYRVYWGDMMVDIDFDDSDEHMY